MKNWRIWGRAFHIYTPCHSERSEESIGNSNQIPRRFASLGMTSRVGTSNNNYLWCQEKLFLQFFHLFQQHFRV